MREALFEFIHENSFLFGFVVRQGSTKLLSSMWSLIVLEVLILWYGLVGSFLSMLGSRIVLKSPIYMVLLWGVMSWKKLQKKVFETESFWEGAYRQ